MTLISDKYSYKCNTIFNGIKKSAVADLEKGSKTIALKKNKILFKEGTYPDGLYKLVRGKVKIYQLNSDGKFQIVYLYTKGEFFGFRPILSNSKHPVSAETMEDCTLIFYPKTLFLNALDSSPRLMKNLLIALSYEFNVWVNLMSTYSHKSVKERVAFTLLILNEKYKRNLSDNIASINIGREDLASFAGTTTETCVRVLTQFKEEGVLSTEGRKIKIRDEDKLYSLSDLH